MVRGPDLLVTTFENGGVDRIFEVPVDYSENKRVLVDELAQRLPVTQEA